MKILVTNDDGVASPGLAALSEALDKKIQGRGDSTDEIVIIAPERPRSASGHSITLHKPLRIEEAKLSSGRPAYCSNGTPSDCVTLGFEVLLQAEADIVISGINAGPNLGWDLSYSGTVSAAIEGAILGAPSFAISVVSLSDSAPLDAGSFSLAADFAVRLAEQIVENRVPPKQLEHRAGFNGLLLNVNVPALPADQINGISLTHQGKRRYVDRVDARVDPWGRPYYWICGNIQDDESDADSDIYAVLHHWISITPLQLDMTAQHQFSLLNQWDLGFPVNHPSER